MNKAQRKAMHIRFLNLMQAVNAQQSPKDPRRFLITIQGHTLGCTFYPAEDARDTAWIACKWETGDPKLLAHYLSLKQGDPMGDETPESSAAYDAYRKSSLDEHQAIMSKHLPYNNPHSLKWNHYGTSSFDPIESLRLGLSSFFPNI